MTDTLFWQAFISLNKSEQKSFKQFLQSPYFNHREDVVLLYDYFLQCANRSKKAPEKDIAYQKMYPKEAYNDHRLRQACSFLLDLVEQFWAIERLKNNESKLKLSTLEEYRKRHLPKHFQRSLIETENAIKQQSFRSAEFHFQQSDFLLEQYRFNFNEKRYLDVNLKAISDQLDYAYFTIKLRQASAAISQQTVYKTDYQIDMIDEIIHHIERHQLENITAIGLYYHTYQCLSNPNEERYFFDLKEKLKESGHFFPTDEIRDLYLLAINYCIKKHNEGHDKFLKAELELYEEGLKNKHLYIDGVLSRFTYRNVVTLALTLKEYEWVEKFIEIYKDDMESIYREGNYAYCRARLAYEKKEFDIVLNLLQQADYEDILISLAAKALLLKTLFEAEAFDSLEAHLEAMRSYIRRKASIIGYHQDNYLNLIKFSKQILKSQHDKVAMQNIYQDIEKTKALAERKWLSEWTQKIVKL